MCWRRPAFRPLRWRWSKMARSPTCKPMATRGSIRTLPRTPQMRYSIGSISKQFTAAAILMLAEEGKLSLDDPVSKYVPGLTRGNEVTIRELLSHTSGYQDFWPQDYVPPLMLQADHAPTDHGSLGAQAAGFRSGNEVAVQQHQLRDRRSDCREGFRHAAAAVSQPAYLFSAGNEERGRHQREQASAHRSERLFSLRAGAAASRAEGRPGLDVRRRRTGDDRRGPGEVGHLDDRPDGAQAGFLSRNGNRGSC